MKIELPLNAASKALEVTYDLAVDAGVEVGSDKLSVAFNGNTVSFTLDEKALPMLATRLDRFLASPHGHRLNLMWDYALLTRHGHAVIQEMVQARSPGYAWKANQFWIDPGGVCLDGWDEGILGPKPTLAEQLEACRAIHRNWLEAEIAAMSGKDGVRPSDTRRVLQAEANARSQTLVTPRRRETAEIKARAAAAKSASAANMAARQAP